MPAWASFFPRPAVAAALGGVRAEAAVTRAAAAPEAEARPGGRAVVAAPAMLSLDFLDDVRRMNKRQVPEGPGGAGRVRALRGSGRACPGS